MQKQGGDDIWAGFGVVHIYRHRYSPHCSVGMSVTRLLVNRVVFLEYGAHSGMNSWDTARVITPCIVMEAARMYIAAAHW